jgi:hypothetical protein
MLQTLSAAVALLMLLQLAVLLHRGIAAWQAACRTTMHGTTKKQLTCRDLK